VFWATCLVAGFFPFRKSNLLMLSAGAFTTSVSNGFYI
jgi:hypothetical protein